MSLMSEHPDTFTSLQGAQSATFCRPPLDGSLTVPELYAFHAEHSRNHPLFVYADPDNAGDNIKTIYYPEAYHAICNASKLVSGLFRQSNDPAELEGLEAPPPLGILAVADTISYATMIAGIMNLGLTPFPISIRNSAEGVANLCKQTGIRQLFVSSDPSTQRLAQQATHALADEGIAIELVPLPRFQALYHHSDSNLDFKARPGNQDSTAIILHSSGSTAFPKPIKLTHRNFLEYGKLPYFGDMDICGLPLAVHALPMFHILGVACALACTAASGHIVACFPPTNPPQTSTPEAFLDGIVATRSQIVFCVPSFVEAWARDSKNLPVLQSLKAVVYGGGPLSHGPGAKLRSAGVNLRPFYGITEAGPMSRYVTTSPQRDEWFEFLRHLTLELIPVEGLPGVAEVVVVASPTLSPGSTNTLVNGKPAYATKDLVERHPTIPHLYKIYGRADDQIMLSTGEKTNPTPLESILSEDPNIKAAIMFGRSRPQNGVLILPKEEFDPSDGRLLTEFRNKIWDTVEKANDFAPSHSRIFKEMIIVTSPSKPLEFTPKGTPRRQDCISQYSKEIDALYAVSEVSAQPSIPAPSIWTRQTISEFVRTVIGSVVQMPLSDDDDLFQQGCDSLGATWIRNTIYHALRSSTNVSVHKIPLSFVYANPSIRTLSDFLYDLVTNSSVRVFEVTVEDMESLVNKYLDGLPVPAWKAGVPSNKQVVLLTGSTGRFGCEILAELLRNSNVGTIFAFNRPSSSADVAIRQRLAFRQWKLDEDLLKSSKLRYLVGDLNQDMLGLTPDAYEELRASVDTIIHNVPMIYGRKSRFGCIPAVARQVPSEALGKHEQARHVGSHSRAFRFHACNQRATHRPRPHSIPHSSTSPPAAAPPSIDRSSKLNAFVPRRYNGNSRISRGRTGDG